MGSGKNCVGGDPAQPTGIGGRIANWFLIDLLPAPCRPACRGCRLGVDRRVDTDVNVPIKPKGYVYHVMILLFG